MSESTNSSPQNGEVFSDGQEADEESAYSGTENSSFPRQPARQKTSLPQRLAPLRSISSLGKNPLAQEVAKQVVKKMIWGLIGPYLGTIIGVIFLILVAAFLIFVGLIHFCKLTPVLSDVANAIPGTRQVCSFFPDLPK